MDEGILSSCLWLEEKVFQHWNKELEGIHPIAKATLNHYNSTVGLRVIIKS